MPTTFGQLLYPSMPLGRCMAIAETPISQGQTRTNWENKFAGIPGKRGCARMQRKPCLILPDQYVDIPASAASQLFVCLNQPDENTKMQPANSVNGISSAISWPSSRTWRLINIPFGPQMAIGNCSRLVEVKSSLKVSLMVIQCAFLPDLLINPHTGSFQGARTSLWDTPSSLDSTTECIACSGMHPFCLSPTNQRPFLAWKTRLAK